MVVTNLDVYESILMLLICVIWTSKNRVAYKKKWKTLSIAAVRIKHPSVVSSFERTSRLTFHTWEMSANY